MLCSDHAGAPLAGRSEATDSSFVPLYLDSSPYGGADDSGYAEEWAASHSPCPRGAEYVAHGDPARSLRHPTSTNLSLVPLLVTTPRESPPVVLTSLYSRDNHQAAHRFLGPLQLTSPQPGIVLDGYRFSSPSHLGLPPSLARAQFISDLPSPRPVDLVESPLPPSDFSGFSYHNLASRSSQSDDVPQASFTLSTDGSPFEYQSHDEFDDEAPKAARCPMSGAIHPILSDETEVHSVVWDPVRLIDCLGELFERADPWSALTDRLGLPSSPVDPTRTSSSSLDLFQRSDRSGVGYMYHQESSQPPHWPDHPPSQTLAEEACTRMSPQTPPENELLVNAPTPAIDPPCGRTAHDPVETDLREADHFAFAMLSSPLPLPIADSIVEPQGATVPAVCSSNSQGAENVHEVPGPRRGDKPEVCISCSLHEGVLIALVLGRRVPGL